MADPFVAEIRIFPFNFAPKGWAMCDGQLLPISQNTALFSLLGTTYGGDGRTTFALPNLQGAAPMHPGQGPGLSLHDLGEQGGSDTVTLLASELAFHTHNVTASASDGVDSSPNNSLPAAGVGIGAYRAPGSNTTLADTSVAAVGGSLPHNNLMPYLTFTFCIALQGIFPPRS
jgi:microcystin-dependent protein